MLAIRPRAATCGSANTSLRVIHRPEGQLAAEQLRQFRLAEPSRPARDCVVDLAGMAPPPGLAGQPLVRCQIRALHDAGEFAPEGIVDDTDGNPAIRRRKQAEGCEQRMTIARRLGNGSLHVVLIDHALAQAQHCIIHADIDKLAVARLLCVADSGDDGKGHHQAGEHIADAWPGFHRMIAVLSGHADEAAHGLGDDIVGRPVRIGAAAAARIAEATDRGIDEGGVDLGK